MKHKMKIERIYHAEPKKWIAMCPCGEVRLLHNWKSALNIALFHFDIYNAYAPLD